METLTVMANISGPMVTHTLVCSKMGRRVEKVNGRREVILKESFKITMKETMIMI